MSIDTTARGGGYYVVYLAPHPIPKDVIDGAAWLRANGTRLSQHVQEREAVEQCSKVLEAKPVSFPYYLHELVVSVVLTGEVATLPPPPPPPPVIPTEGAIDVLDAIEKLVPDVGKAYVIRTDNFYLGLDLSITRSKTELGPKKVRFGTKLGEVGRWVGITWRGWCLLWKDANARFLVTAQGAQ